MVLWKGVGIDERRRVLLIGVKWGVIIGITPLWGNEWLLRICEMSELHSAYWDHISFVFIQWVFHCFRVIMSREIKRGSDEEGYVGGLHNNGCCQEDSLWCGG